MKNLFFTIAIVLLVNFIAVSQVSVTATAGTLGPTTYTNLRLAFAAINGGTHQGDITISITGNFSDNNTWVLNASGSGSASYTSVTISPSGGAVRTISGSYNGVLLDLNGANNVTINGLNTDGNGLIISNTNTGTSASTIRFINGASSNTIRKCTIQGSGLGVYGIIDFSTSSGLTGNNNNNISGNSITRAGENRPNRVITSFGTSGKENTGNIISDNNIFNFLIHGTASFGIYLRSFTTAWTISGNSFYETASFVPTTTNVTYYILNIDNTSGNNFTISDNFIGGSEPECSGSPWTKTNARDNVFYAIYLNLGTSTASNVQGNKISNISWANSSSAYWYGIYINSGRVNVGTSSGNIIGAPTGNGSITFTYGNANPFFYGILLSSNSASVDCQNNTIASITTTSTSTNMGIHFYAIYNSGSGTTTISNNTIGSTSTSNSINASNTAISSPQRVYGIISGGTGSLTISNNTIANIRNATTHSTTTTTGVINGILITQGSNTVTNNTIHDLSISNANNASTNDASAAGIVFNNTSGTQNISGNVIYNISNTRADFAGTVTGLYYSGPTTASTVSRNFIHSLSVDASTTNASVYGIRINAGVTTYSNNIIYLGGNTQTTLYGIYETGAASNNNNLYFNTVYLSGNPTTGALNSYALYSNASTNTRNFRNNILVNARSNNGATGKNYAIGLNYATDVNLNLNFNNYLVPGSGGVLGYYNSSDITTLPIVTGMDSYSKNINPNFASAGSTTANGYLPSETTLSGITISTSIDYGGNTRQYYSMGAWDYQVNELILPVKITSTNINNGISFTLKEAFDEINSGFYQGTIAVSILSNTTETSTAVLNVSGSGSASYASVAISPYGGESKTISGDIAGALINLNGATNVNIDGLNSDGNSLTISNTNTGTSASTIQFINGATSNTITRCTIQGSTTSTSSGIMFFSTSTGSTGNINNTISNNSITHAGAAANRPTSVIYSQGTSGKANDGNIISNNNIFNFFRTSAASYGIRIISNTNNWTISGNSFYETTSFAPSSTAEYRVINIVDVSGTNFSITGNFIGGTTSGCGGAAWTKTNANNNTFYAIYMWVGTSSPSSIHGNTISNFSWANSSTATWYGIWINGGNVNIGIPTGNTIGSATGTGSITFTGGANGAYFYGIYLAANPTVDCRNNVIGSITTAASSTSNGTNFYGIYKTGAGTTTIKGNTIGSISTANSINTSSTSTSYAQYLYGMNFGSSLTTLTVEDNIIANLSNGTTNTTTSTDGCIRGIQIMGSSGVFSIANNTIRDLSILNRNTNVGETMSAAGIVFNNTSANAQAISQNVIYNISNSNTGFAGTVCGLLYYGPSTSSLVTRNFIHSLSVNSTSASIYGIRITGGTTTYANNIIAIAGNTRTTLYGIYENGSSVSNNNSLYFNTVYIGGAPIAGALNSYALYSNSAQNIRNFRNNVFVNARSNGGSASGSHYAAFFNYGENTNLTLDYNDYFVSGIGGVLGRYNSANVTSLPLITSNDANSKNVDPEFSNAGGTTSANYQTSNRTIIAVAETGTTIDYAGEVRDLSYPTMGAYENSVPLPVELTSFTAKVANNNVTLNWQTATEVNNYGFEVQRSVVSSQRSEETWEKVGFVEGNGNSNSVKDYSFVDESVSGGKYSYRLKQIDTDGGFSYSEIVEVEIANIPTEYVLYQNYPNPFNPSTTIKFGLPKDSKVMLEVYNIIGEKVKTLVNQEMSAGYHTISFTGNELATGIYIYKLTANDFSSTKKFVLMK